MALQSNLGDIGPLTVTPVDVGGALAQGDKDRTIAAQNEQKRTAIAQEAADNAALKDYLSVPNTDLYTSKGVADALPMLKGRISPKTYMDLATRQADLKAHEGTYAASVAKLDAQTLQTHMANQDYILGTIGPLAEFKGTDEEWPAYLSSQVDAATGLKRPDGTPLIPASEVDSIKKMPQTAFKQMYAGTKVAKGALDDAKIASETKAQEALAADRLASAEMKKGMGPIDQWSDPATGAQYIKGSKSGKMFKVEDDGSFTPVNVMPANAVKLGAKGSVKAEEAAGLTDEENTILAEYQTTTGKQIPGIPAGSGAAARTARINYMKSFVKLIKDRGYTGDEAGLVAIQRDASKEAAKRLTTQGAVIEAGENDLRIVGKVIEDELTKLGGPNSPLVRKYWNKASTEWMGDPQFSGLNAAMANFQETAARVFSGQSGAGGTPVTYLALAESAIGKNPTLEQFSKTNEVMGKLFEARKTSTDGAIKSLMAGVQMPAKAGSTAADQKKKDTDAVDIQRAELQKTRQALITLKSEPVPADPAKKKAREDEIKRYEGDVASLEREIKRMGGTLDAPAPAPAPAPTAPTAPVAPVAGALTEARKAELAKKYNLTGNK